MNRALRTSRPARALTSLVVFALAIGLLSGIPAAYPRETLRFYSLAADAVVPEEAFAAALAAHRFVLVGEHHTSEDHHRWQLGVIRRLAARGPVAIGLEMMRGDSQPSLDAWVAGELSEDEIEAVYQDNWNFPWSLYRPIFMFAREHRIPMVGLNVPREVTRQVAREGFESLSPSQREGLPFVACRVDEDYLAYIREAYGAHAHGDMAFTHFCEAQLVWDKAMAVNALRFAETHRSRQIIILTGTGHARKGGIPHQLEALGQSSFQVVLPQIPSVLDPQTLDSEDADFLLQGM